MNKVTETELNSAMAEFKDFEKTMSIGCKKDNLKMIEIIKNMLVLLNATPADKIAELIISSVGIKSYFKRRLNGFEWLAQHSH
ncbi:hypothetical protein [Histophilus somni]|uniref:hypothetical protein n=1 Tax=Histophilus somni TaxID=731 RepID=UPI00094B1F46|nr:hypothetical protein [Histophilus somni]